MDFLHSVLIGFYHCLEPLILLYCFIGVFIGTLVGVLPGIGPAGALAILLPATYNAPPLASIVMLSGIYYGALYGGSTTSILVNIPGEPASIITCLDGYKMARQGRAGPALGISAFGSFIAGTMGVIGLMALAYPLAQLALGFGPFEYFSLMILGLILLSYLGQKSFIRSLIMAALGLLLSFVGTDVISGQERFTFGVDELYDGIPIVPMVMGLFGIAEILENIEMRIQRDIFKTSVRELLPTVKDWTDSIWPIIRGTVVGFFLGILPGGGAILASFASYAIEKRVSKHPERFGTGAIEGVAGPESANNAASSAAFIPLLTLGIPSNVIMAMLFAGLLLHGIKPGPLLLKDHPDIFWGVITSMYFGNVILLALNLPLIGLWVQLLKIPFRYLFPTIILFCFVGVYSINSVVFDIGMMIAFGVAGYMMRKLNFEPPLVVLAFVLGPLIEENLRRGLIISHGSFTMFFVRPISGVCMAVALMLLILACVPFLRKKREQMFQVEESRS